MQTKAMALVFVLSGCAHHAPWGELSIAAGLDTRREASRRTMARQVMLRLRVGVRRRRPPEAPMPTRSPVRLTPMPCATRALCRWQSKAEARWR